jgi:hypothetical protein
VTLSQRRWGPRRDPQGTIKEDQAQIKIAWCGFLRPVRFDILIG